MAIKFLLADDSPTIRRIFINILKEIKGYDIEVLEAKDGIRTINANIEHKPDVIILNLHITGRGALETIPVLVKRLKPYIAIVSTDSDKKNQMAMELGAKKIFTKPLDKKTIDTKIKQILLELENQKKDG